ncbi:uncharacterized protein C8R40DRAFT_1261516 [Lentinula edodes]|uniref:uncharacterized protein n=1 Tax=Lentinula edodes TaxID=5353 RepID=UPI001E8D76C2|nr:uncharacterized protein C8R40DRAFT_1261516 [Lentinula edodes]KAH7880899.1 hypothetical protein C8R40DRAFT_1261516 [Lentinula edodes]
MQESSEEAGPSNTSNPNKPNNSTSANPTFPSHPHPTRIHFPNPNINTQPHINAQPSNTNSRANVKTSLNLNNAIAGSSKDTSTSARRRVVSVDAGNPYGSLRGTRSGLGATSGMGRRMPTMSMGATGTSGRRVASLESTDSKESQPDSSSADSGWGMGTFSDEYDLSHEDPRILQDVQRALKLKHRREARRKSGQLDGPVPAPGTGSLTMNRPSSPLRSSVFPISTSPTPVLTTTTDVTQPSSTSAPLAPSSTTTPSAPTASPISTLTAPSTADIDFSPSTGPSVVRVRVDPLRRLHPIPLSNDGGETLDWSGSGSVNGYGSEDEKSEKAEKSEKRWSLSVSRRGKEKEKEKDKERELLPSAEDLKRLEGLYVAKLSRIKSASSQSTSKKVAITADQIGRRYNLIYTSLLTPGSTLLPNHQSDITTTSASETDIKEFNLLKVSKWYSAQDPLVRSSLEKAEPFIWLKHLEKKRNLKQPKGEEGHKDKAGGEEDNVKEDPSATTTTRLPWHLSALIMEEYILAQSAKNHSHFPAFPVRNIPHLQPPLKPINPNPYAARSMRSIPEHPSSPDSATHTHDFGKDYVLGTNMPSPPDDGGGGGTGSLNDLLPPFIPSGYSTPSAYSAYSPPSVYSNYSPPSTYSTHSAPSQSQQSRSAPYTPRTPYTPYSPYTLLNNNNNNNPSTSPPSPQHGRISFEPLLDPPSFINRPSNESRRSLESTFSSIFSSGGGVGNTNTNTNTPAPGGAVFSSPASSRSRLHIRDSFGLRKPRSTTTAAAVNANDSDDGNGYGSSARNSATEQSDNGGGDRGEESFIHVESEEPETATPAPGVVSPTGNGGSGVVGPGSSGAVNVVGATVSPNAVGSNFNSHTALRANANTRNLRPLRPLRNRNSLPTTEEDRITLAIERKRKQEAEEAREDMEYELKAQLVASCKDSNAHIRSVLNHIAQHMREYEMCQASFIAGESQKGAGGSSHGGHGGHGAVAGAGGGGGRGGGGGFGYTAISPELFEAFSHDPANVTSSTKRLKTYRAVDDIHHRLTRQRAVFAEFLAQNSKDSGSDGPETQDILQAPIEDLMRTLKKLEHHRLDVVNREKEVSEMLRETQVVHAEVKKEYNSTLAHTSVVYPELSQIVALEESYKDQYQHLWDIGMDALTFILDSVTPFWRSYGKLIGDDVQDFLIVPLYRNEYTGEAKRYPIPRLPAGGVVGGGGVKVGEVGGADSGVLGGDFGAVVSGDWGGGGGGDAGGDGDVVGWVVGWGV